MAEAANRKSVLLLTATALLLALASVVLTRALRMFTVAEALAVAAFVAGLGLYIAHRRSGTGAPLGWPRGLIVGGSVLAFIGLALKGLFVQLGIGAPKHDMATHLTTPGNPLLEHVHHLLFNVGFLLFAIAAAGLLVSRLRR